MRARPILLLFLSVSLFGQASYQAMYAELLTAFQENVADSTSVPVADQVFIFHGDSEVETYLAAILQERADAGFGQTQDTIQVNRVSTSITLNHTDSKTFWNSAYLRKLKCRVEYQYGARMFTWKGSIADRLRKNDLRQLLDEPVPVVVSGDHLQDQPAPIIIIIATLGVLSLAAGLYFIRT